MDLRVWMFLLSWIKKSNVIEKTLENQNKKNMSIVNKYTYITTYQRHFKKIEVHIH